MATGRVGAEDLAADTDTTVYQCPAETFAAISATICNRSNDTVLISLSVCATETPGPDEYIEFETELPARGTLERTGIVISPEKYLIARSNSANVNIVAYGIESALVAPVAVPPSSPSPSPSPTPTYAVAPAANNVNEGSSLEFTVTTTNVSNGTTLYWTVTNAGDFGTSSGSFTVNSNSGTFSVTPTADTTTEGAETFTASVRTGSTSGDIVATSSTVTINDTSIDIVLGSPFTDISWTTVSKPAGVASTELFSNYVVADDNRIIVIPTTTDNRTLWESTDGATFSIVTLPAASIDQRAAAIAKNNSSGRIVVMGQDLTASWVSTDDGATWTAYNISSLTKPAGTTTAYPPRMAFANGVFKLMMGNSIGETDPGISAYSTDGITWTQGTMNPSSFVVSDISVPAASQNEILFGNGTPLDYYYYSAADPPNGEVIVQGPVTNFQMAPNGIQYASDLGWLIQGRTDSYFLQETDITAFDDSTSTRVTHNITGGGESLGVLDSSISNKPSVVLVGPWNAGDTWRINYNLADGAAWQNTTLPASFSTGNNAIIAANGKFYVSQFNSSNIHVGTLATL